MKLNRTIFNEVFKTIMDERELKGIVLAKASGRSATNISEIRKGYSYPTIGDFAELLVIAEELCPGFFESFARKLICESKTLNNEPKT